MCIDIYDSVTASTDAPFRKCVWLGHLSMLLYWGKKDNS